MEDGKPKQKINSDTNCKRMLKYDIMKTQGLFFPVVSYFTYDVTSKLLKPAGKKSIW
jgi:hypothetical protein